MFLLGSATRPLVISFGIWVIVAQALQIPPTWQDTTSNLSRQAREDLASGAATALVDQVDPSGGGVNDVIPNVKYLSSLFSGLAIQDHLSGNTSWVDKVTQVMQENYRNNGVYSAPPANGGIGDVNYWALAFYYAYRTYKQEFLLDTAIQIYNITNATAFITASAAASGSGAGRNVSFSPQSHCTNASIAGGVFAVNSVPTLLDVCGECTGSFLALSAYLFEATNISAYSEAAQLSVDFIINHTWNGSIVYDTFRPNDCTSDPKPITLSEAGFVEGLAVWANVTKNSTLTSFLETVVSGVTTFPGWSLDGTPVITESGSLQQWDYNSKNLFIRGLAEARARNPGTELARYIEAYIMIQFNSVLTHAQGLAPNNNFYGTDWTGQRPTSFSVPGNLAALEVMNAAFSFASPSGTNASVPSSSTSVGPTGTSPSSPPRNVASNTGAIAGGVVGGVVAVIVLTVAFLLWRHRRKHARNNEPSDAICGPASASSSDTSGAVDPFILSPPASQLSSKRQDIYAPRRDEIRSSSSMPRQQSERSNAPEEDGDRDQAVTTGSEQVRAENQMQVVVRVEPNGVDDVPNLVGRLYNLLHGHQGELPPAYGS